MLSPASYISDLLLRLKVKLDQCDITESFEVFLAIFIIIVLPLQFFHAMLAVVVCPLNQYISLIT